MLRQPSCCRRASSVPLWLRGQARPSDDSHRQGARGTQEILTSGDKSRGLLGDNKRDENPPFGTTSTHVFEMA